MPYRLKISLLGLVTLAWLVVFFDMPSLVYADNFYGSQSLEPMVRENGTTVYLPGGTELEIKDNEIDYTITDHLLSQRLVVADDNALSGQAEYTPFGNSSSAGDIGIAARYTGMLFEPETATYDYHARSYDPTVVRFGSVDAIRASISPYSYTANNPINYIDPDGQGKINFWLVYTPTNQSEEYMLQYKKLIGNRVESIESNPKEKISVIQSELLKRTKPTSYLALEADDRIGHLTVTFEARDFVQNFRTMFPNLEEPESFSDAAGVAGRIMHHIDEDLKFNNPRIPKELKSILIEGAGLAEDTAGPIIGDGNSVANLLGYGFDYKKFPNLESIIASPYELDVVTGIDFGYAKSSILILSKYNSGVSDGNSLTYIVDSDAYHSGNLPERLFKPPSVENGAIFASGSLEIEKYEHPHDINKFIRDRGFTEPVFKRFKQYAAPMEVNLKQPFKFRAVLE